MKHRITVGEVDIRTDMELSPRQLRQLLMEAAGVAAVLAHNSPEEPEPKPPVGFTAHLELDPERNAADDLSEWFEEEEGLRVGFLRPASAPPTGRPAHS